MLEAVEPDADRLGALVERRPDVDVLAEVVAADHLEDEPVKLVDGRHVVHQHDLAGVPDPLDVLAHLQRVELPLLLVPVGADALEDRRPVHEGVGHDADLRLAHRDELALEVADQAARGRAARARRRSRVRLAVELAVVSVSIVGLLVGRPEAAPIARRSRATG